MEKNNNLKIVVAILSGIVTIITAVIDSNTNKEINK
ncbi:Uncharacterised protein [Myroides odoratus]|uniref:Uncharacterized protein n=1 Tax=Myroides odoratus TaxID=256 RepID=A0A378RJT9_MYROD|nr:Uncharacterised protein [Myroides odoratus]